MDQRSRRWRGDRAIRMRGGARRALVLVSVLVAGCGATEVSREQARLGERQLLQPYLRERLVVCSELDVEITPNFHRHVSNPGVDKTRQQFERIEREALVEKVWTNPTGTEAGWFTVTIGEPPDPVKVDAAVGPRTTFKVMNRFTLRVRERGEMALTARASGPVVAVQEAGAEAQPVREFAVVDGVLQR